MTIKKGLFELRLKFDGVQVAKQELKDYNAVENLVKDLKNKFK